MKENVACLLYKKEDLADPRNWRPITLVTLDIKINTKVIATRIRNITNQIIGQEQV